MVFFRVSRVVVWWEDNEGGGEGDGVRGFAERVLVD